MIAARQIAFGKAAGAKKGLPAKDYIQNGLVAMWDGIENVGFGEHNPNATVWTDCVNGIIATPNNFKNVDDYSFGREDGFCKVRHCNLGISDTRITDVMNLPQCSYEIMLCRRTGTSRLYFLSNNTVGSWQNSNNDFYVTKGAQDVRTNVGRGGNFTLDQHRSLTVVFDNGKRFVYVNGNLFKEASVTEVSSNRILFLFGTGYLYDNFTTCADINFARIRSRALTAEEIAYNYNIDKQRFGL